MTASIQANIEVRDKIAPSIERNLGKIALQAGNANRKISGVAQALTRIDTTKIIELERRMRSLSTVNPFKGVDKQILSFINAQSQAIAKLTQQANALNNVQINTTRLTQAQAKLALEQQRIATETAKTNLQVAKSSTELERKRVVQEQGRIAQERYTKSVIDTAIAEARLENQKVLLAQRMERLRRMQEQAKASNDSYRNSIVRVAGALATLYAGMMTARSLVTVADSYQSLINKLTLITGSADVAKERLGTLAQVAMSSYAPIESVTQLYQRLDMAFKQMGKTTSEAVQATETLTKAVSLSGLTTAEAGSALLQISQAFNKGKIDGDEFRTMMETMPLLADHIAERLKVTRGELLALAPKGKITAKVMQEALVSMAEEVDRKFAQMTPTIGMSLENIATQAKLVFGSIFTNSGGAEALSTALGYVANNMGKILEIATVLGASLATIWVAKHVVEYGRAIATTAMFVSSYGKAQAMATAGTVAFANGTQIATTWVGRLGMAIRATPFGLVLTGMTLLYTAGTALYTHFTGKSLFPSFEQDRAKVDDFISRIQEVNLQISTMSSTKLYENYVQGRVAIDELNKKREEEKARLAEIAKELERLNKYKQYAVAVNKQEQNSLTDLWGSYNNLGVSQKKLTETEEEINRLKAEQAKLYDDSKQSIQDQISALENNIYTAQTFIEKYEASAKALEGKRKEDIEASRELTNHNAIVVESREKYEAMKISIATTTAQLKALLALDPSNVGKSFDKGIDLAQEIKAKKEAEVQAEKDKQNQVVLTSFKKEQAKIEDHIAMSKARASGDLKKQAELIAKENKNYENYLKLNTEGKELKAGEVSLAQSLIDSELKRLQVEEQIANSKKESRKAQSEADKAQRKVEREREQAQKRQERDLQKANDMKQDFVKNLELEHTLLKEGYSNYQNYLDLYKLKHEMQQKGVNLSEQEITQLKAKIDLVNRLKAEQEYVAELENNSYEKRKEQALSKVGAISKANLSVGDRMNATNDTVAGMGIAHSPDMGISKLQDEYALRQQMLQQMRQNELITEQQHKQALFALEQQHAQNVYNLQLENMQNMGGLWTGLATAVDSFNQNATNSVMNVLNGTQSLGGAMRDLSVTILNSVVQSFVRMGVEWITQQMMMLATSQSVQATQTAGAIAQASAITSAYMPAATVTAMATQGASVGVGMTALMGAMMTIPMLIGLAGKRRNGGAVNAGSLYQVGEGNAPEIYRSNSGKQYMITGDRGRVFSNKDVTSSGGGIVVNQYITFENGSDTDNVNQIANMVKSAVYEILKNEKRGAGGMLA